MLVSAFAFGGIPEEAVKRAFSDNGLYVSPALLKEYRDVPLELIAEGKIDRLQLKALIAGIAAFVTKAKVVNPQKKFIICRDPEDNMVLDCCFAAGANILITGDKDLLDLKELPFKLKIMTPKGFLKERSRRMS